MAVTGQDDHPQSIITVAARFFGVGSLDFRLSGADRRRIAYASLLPILAIVLDVVLFLLQVFKDIPYGTGGNFARLQSGFWWHVYTFTGTLREPVPALSVGVLFLFSIYPVNRPQGSLAFAISAFSAVACIVLAIYTAFPTLLYNYGESLNLATKWYTLNTRMLAQDLGFLTIGYAFLAYRGLSRHDVGRRVYGQRRRRYPGAASDAD